MRGRGQPARDGLRILVAGLAQVSVEVREPGRDDDPVGGHAIGIAAVQPRLRLEDPASDDDLARALTPPDRIDDPGPADLKIRHAGDPAGWCPLPCVPASR